MEERQCEARIMHRGYIYTEEKILLSLVTGIIRFSTLVISRFEIMPVPRHEIYIYIYTYTCACAWSNAWRIEREKERERERESLIESSHWIVILAYTHAVVTREA